MNKIIVIIIIVIVIGGGALVAYYLPQGDSNGQVVACSAESRNADACIQVYDPVCGKVNVQCVTTPCDPVHETFSNSCTACQNSLVESYTEGECLPE